MLHRPTFCAALAVLAALLLGGCTGESENQAGPKDGPSVIAPGKPGEKAATLSVDEALKARGNDSPNSADVAYVQMMIKHHEQAIVMTDLSAKHAKSQKVTGLSARIAAAQRAEIDYMGRWLKANGSERGGGHDHEAMQGMATEAQLAELRAARGADFDELFLQLMIKHHQGAIAMAENALAKGNNVLVEEMATEVIAQQTIEIERMRKMEA